MFKSIFVSACAFFGLLAVSGINHSAEAAYRCQAQDAGYEEHFFGHSNCSDCLRKHDRCVETCSESGYECRAEGPNGRRGLGYSDFSEWEAQDRALWQCGQNCKVVQCRENERVVSRRSCYGW